MSNLHLIKQATLRKKEKQMNKSNLQSLFKKYIDNFEKINAKETNETYKWEIAEEFQSFNIEAKDFTVELNKYWKISNNLIDSSQQLPFYALVDYAKKEPETVRDMFRKLYKAENLDASQKQLAIDKFIEESESLRKKYNPTSRLYVNNQRSVMMYLFLRYPEHNFGYKAAQAKRFADCIEFYEDWGTMNDFHLDVYCRMCEEVIEEIKKCEPLLITHLSRYKNTNRKLYKDTNMHILLSDIIYSSQVYDLYDGINFNTINAKARNLYFERVAKAARINEKYLSIKKDVDMLEEANDYITKNITPGTKVISKSYGEGIVENYADTYLTVYFNSINERKKFELQTAIGSNSLKFTSEEIMQKLTEYIPLLNRANSLKKELSRTEEELQQYLEYLQ